VDGDVGTAQQDRITGIYIGRHIVMSKCGEKEEDVIGVSSYIIYIINMA
jgi:hypothetical protein